MQTFLPDRSFVSSMEYLDSARLGKQRIEAAQILEILLDQPILPKSMQCKAHFDRSFSNWTRHPAVLMWKGHEEWLKLYLDCCVGEWLFRGFTNAINVPKYDTDSQPHPKWWGFEAFHKSHRSNLIRKCRDHYAKYWPDEIPNLPYFWPTKEGF